MSEEYTFDPIAFLDRLISDLEALAAPTDAMIHWVREEPGWPMEELWLGFADDVDEVRFSIAEGALPASTAVALEALYAHMESMTSVHFASFEVLDDPVWQRVRELAADALEAIRAVSLPGQPGLPS